MRSMGWLAVAALVAAAGCGDDGAGDGAAPATPAEDAAPELGEMPEGVSREQGEEGRRLYAAACVMCHGETAEGTQLGPALASGEWSRGGGSLAEIAAVVAEGAPATDEFGVPMPARGDGTFTDEQIAAVSAYVYSLSRGRSAPAADTAQATG